jgi:hypothetical protein
VRRRTLVVGVHLVLASCAFDWDGYDPRLRPSAPPEGPCQPGAERGCYSGPAGTAGVGVCLGGTQVCGGDAVFGPCEGEVLPGAEVCENTTDDDCDGVVLDVEDGCGCMPGETVQCYDGPPRTEGVGSCRAGEATCNARGNGFETTCVGEVVPILEECGNEADDDCNTSSDEWCAAWSRRYPGTGMHQNAWGAAYGGGRLVIGGEIHSATDLGLGPIAGQTLGDGFVAQIDAATGDTEWVLHLGGAGDQYVNQVAVDALGNVYASGGFDTQLAPGGGLTPLTAVDGFDAFVLKISSAGVPVWVWHGAGTLDQAALAVAVDGTGAVAVGGFFSGTMTIGADVLTAIDQDAFIAKLDPAGAPLWSFGFGEGGDDVVYDVTVDGAGAIFLAGEFDESMNLGGGAVDDEGSLDGFAGSLGPDGSYRWLHTIGGDGTAHVYALSLAPNGDVAVIGEFNGTVDLPGGVLTASLGDVDAFVLELDADGAYLWDRVFGGPDEEQAKDVASGPNGEVLVGLDFHASLAVGDDLVVTGGNGDMVVVLLDGAGAPQLVRRFGEHYDENVRQVLLPDSDTILLTGDCDGNFDFGSGWLGFGQGYDDLCLAQLVP